MQQLPLNSRSTTAHNYKSGELPLLETRNSPPNCCAHKCAALRRGNHLLPCAARMHIRAELSKKTASEFSPTTRTMDIRKPGSEARKWRGSASHRGRGCCGRMR